MTRHDTELQIQHVVFVAPVLFYAVTRSLIWNRVRLKDGKRDSTPLAVCFIILKKNLEEIIIKCQYL